MKQPELGKKVADVRRVKGLTQDDLAQKCNLSLRTIQRIESGLVNPRSYTLKAIGITLDYNFYNSASIWKDLIFRKSGINYHLRFVFQLFNLKTNTMKKLTILFAVILLAVLCIFIFCTESTAQKSEYNYTKTTKKGVIYMFPKGLKIKISNEKDTMDYMIGNDLIQNYNQKIYFNGCFAGKVNIGDTVFLDNGNLNILSSFWEFKSSSGKGITYLIPKELKMNSCRVNKETESLVLDGNLIIDVHKNSVFLNKSYIGEAFQGDFVTLRNGTLYISKGAN